MTGGAKPRVDTYPTDARVRRLAIQTLDRNRSRRHTVPSRTLYPHQWSWDTGFIGVGLAHYAPRRSWLDLRALFRAQWADGRVPHIVFDPGVPPRDYFPGPDLWQTTDVPAAPPTATSGVVQPPVHALAAWEIYRSSPGDAARRAGVSELRWLYPRLVAQQRYLTDRRDIGGDGLVCVVHPWESGLDNSPAWDAAMAAVPTNGRAVIPQRRRDLAVAVAEHRPTHDDYARYLTLVTAYRDHGYQDAGLADRHLFLVECPAFNAITAAAERTLADIAEVVGADPAEHRDRAARLTAVLVDRLYDPGTGMFHARDMRTGRLSPARCVSGLIPLMLPDLPAGPRATILAEAASSRFGLAEDMVLPLPSYDRTAPDYDPLRYWRGPVWINVNWLIWRGLRRHGETRLAAALRRSMIDLVGAAGCSEYFHPVTGAGIGASEFSWTAALALDLLAHANDGDD